jgi:hypothetical protein
LSGLTLRLALVWERLVLSTPRQSGKSTLLREFGTWRLHAGEIFGEPQAITYVANNLGTSLGVMAPLWSRTKADPDNYRTTQTNGRPDVHLLADGSRFSLRAGRATYGGSNSLVVVDEGFAIEPGILADAIEPTILETAEPQIILSSTANRFATALMLSERAAALAAMAEPERALIIEWGAARAEDVADVGTWRKSSPHWHAQRQRLIADRYTKASAGVVVDTIGQEFNPMESFRSQYLNTWPESTEPAKAETGEPLVTAEEWTASAVAGWPSLRADGWAAAQVVAAVETAAGRSAGRGHCRAGGRPGPDRGFPHPRGRGDNPHAGRRHQDAGAGDRAPARRQRRAGVPRPGRSQHRQQPGPADLPGGPTRFPGDLRGPGDGPAAARLTSAAACCRS